MSSFWTFCRHPGRSIAALVTLNGRRAAWLLAPPGAIATLTMLISVNGVRMSTPRPLSGREIEGIVPILVPRIHPSDSGYCYSNYEWPRSGTEL